MLSLAILAIIKHVFIDSDILEAIKTVYQCQNILSFFTVAKFDHNTNKISFYFFQSTTKMGYQILELLTFNGPIIFSDFKNSPILS